MKKLILVGGILALSMSVAAQSATLTFDDIPGGSVQNAFGDMPTYKGFNFSFTLDWIDLEASSWNYGAHSGDFGILNNNHGTGIVTEASGADFTFDGLWAKNWATSPDSGGADTSFGNLQGYNNGSLVWSVATSLNGSYENYGAQAGAIDELRLGFGGVFLVDDLSLNGVSVSAVPIPAAAFLFAPALLGFMGLRRKAKNSVA